MKHKCEPGKDRTGFLIVNKVARESLSEVTSSQYQKETRGKLGRYVREGKA